MTKAKEVTTKHIDRVRDLLYDFINKLYIRGRNHDLSKFEPVEADALETMQELVDREGQAPYGSDEYKKRLEILKPMLEHHYANNSHHPEHYENGVAGMCLLDLVEMFFDWKAASERGEESSLNITASVERFKIEPQLASILRNTADRFGFKHS